MNQSRLLSSCGLNNAKHKEILEDMAEKGFLESKIEQGKNQSVLKYRISEKGIKILNEVFERYEMLFPRGGEMQSNKVTQSLSKSGDEIR
ncbi:MAG: hypothetical protein ACR2LL_05825 [Nitrosopumilus sp.]